MRRRYEFKGRAKTIVGFGVLAIVAWSLLGRPLIDFNLGFFNRGFQFSVFRAGHFEKHGIYWQQHDVRLGHIVSPGGETLTIDLDARIARGILVLYAWRWPGFLHDEPVVERFRFERNAAERLQVALPDAGIYVLSASGVIFRGDVDVDWRVGSVVLP
jgi:hypothetical protein